VLHPLPLPQAPAPGLEAQRRLRLLHFSNADARGGAEEHMLTLLRGLDHHRFELHVACPPALAAHLRDLPEDVQLCPAAPHDPWSAGPGLALRAYLRRHCIDVLHAHISCSSRAAAPWAWWAGTPIVVETPHVRESWRQGWRKAAWMDRIAGRGVDAYIAVSEANALYLRDDRGLPPEKIHLIRNGVDVGRFRMRTAPQLDPRPALGIAPGELLLLCVARLEPQKGHAVLLEAMAQLLPATPPLRLVCLGEGRLAGALRAQAAKLGLGARVLFPGFCPNVATWLSVADIFVLPSFYEGLPLSAMEAAAAGCPIVATDVDGTPEVVEDGGNGLLVPAGDSRSLSQALLRLIADPELRRRFSESGRQRAARQFDQRRQVEETSRLYLQLWRKTAPRRRRAASGGPLG